MSSSFVISLINYEFCFNLGGVQGKKVVVRPGFKSYRGLFNLLCRIILSNLASTLISINDKKKKKHILAFYTLVSFERGKKIDGGSCEAYRFPPHHDKLIMSLNESFF